MAVYRELTKLMSQRGIKWAMMSYCWGELDEETKTWDMQEMVLRVYKELIRRRIRVDGHHGRGGDGCQRDDERSGG